MRYLAFAIVLLVACDKKPDATPPAPATGTSAASVATGIAPLATTTSTGAPTAGSAAPAAGSHASYTFVCTLKPGSVYLAAGSAGSGPKDPDPSRAVGEATFVLTSDAAAVSGSGSVVLGDVVAQGAADANLLAVTFGPKENLALAFRGILDVDTKTGGTLRASTGNGDSIREGACVLKP